MKITLFGGTGTIGQRILDEALRRGHEVTAVVHRNHSFNNQQGLNVVNGDIDSPADVARVSEGADVLASAFGPSVSNPAPIEPLLAATKSLIEGAKQSGVPRLITVGGAGGLEVSPGVRLIDTQHLPEAWKPIAQAHIDALDVLKGSDINWTNISPAALIQPGTRTGKYRTSENTLVTDPEGNSTISCEDYAVAFMDEIEHPKHERKRFAVGN
jgi:putative NADH-flavin reductase